MREFFEKPLQWLAIALSIRLERVIKSLNAYVYRVHNNNSDSTRQIADDLLAQNGSSVDLLYGRANGYAETLESCDGALKEAVRLYFLAKQAVIYYDARVSSIPVQVFNELRNALDHFFRSVIYIDGNPAARDFYRKSHIKKMEGHLQRAFLDVAKLGCGKISEQIDNIHSRFGSKAIARAADGIYARDISALCSHAEALLISAKQSEAQLGGNNDDDVRQKFILAFAAYVAAADYQKKKIPSLYWAKSWIYGGILKALLIAAIGKFGYDVFVKTPYAKALIDATAHYLQLAVEFLRHY